ncbi:MAG: hypothetical protein U0974_12340 [Gemmatimonadales bacterium]|nr:hypothetical protein [Gemmatimonadales bacterium]MDZ4390504.1 hypothetical protein [Gemmatimonadales bacterium]
MITVTLCEAPANPTGLNWAAIREDMPGGVGIGATTEDALADMRRIVEEYNRFVAGDDHPRLDPDPPVQYRVVTCESDQSFTVTARPSVSSATVFAPA